MTHPYRLADEADIVTPALVFFPEIIQQNIKRVIELAGSPDRLRPHAKTHKTREIVQMQLAAGVRKHKCATIAEAELLADGGVPDVLIAYQLLGPNLNRLANLARKFPDTQFSGLIDCASGAVGLSHAATEAGRDIGFMVDLDVGQHRTGIAVGPEAAELYEHASRLPGLRAEGLHAYDGHNTQQGNVDRTEVAQGAIKAVLDLRDQLMRRGLSVPRIVAGGTPSFPVYTRMREVEGLECSPGTYVLHDHGYGSKYTDLPGITPAAVLLTRVVSRPTPARVTFDLGSKSVSPDLPLANRVHLLDMPDASIVGHNEEHLIIETPIADQFTPGDVAYALPGHICPTVALHRDALIAVEGRITARWVIAARDRMLTV